MHIFLTGASTGIGNAIARELDRHFAGSAFFSLVSRRKELLEALAKELDGRAAVYPADLSEPAIAETVLEQAVQEHGPVDILINNAGVQHIDHFTSIQNEDAEKLLRLNYLTPARLMRRVLPTMAERNNGTIVNIASIGAIIPTPYMAEYCASKAALAALATALAGEYKDTQIHFLTVYPGPIATAMAEYADTRYGKGVTSNVPFGTAEELAKEIRIAIAKKKHKLIYPAFYRGADLFRDFSIWLTAHMAPKPK
ncbi:MAG: SDR family NAD(P)-dependent oxidoreductase [Leptospiraceae bacterium]|nr:SDR family NAD(P)-dependent oxidoreductase [Leptospiraceae bacterium]